MQSYVVLYIWTGGNYVVPCHVVWSYVTLRYVTLLSSMGIIIPSTQCDLARRTFIRSGFSPRAGDETACLSSIYDPKPSKLELELELVLGPGTNRD